MMMSMVPKSLTSFVTQRKKTIYYSLMLLVIAFALIYFGHIAYKNYKIYSGYEGLSAGGDEEPQIITLYFFYADWCPHCKVAKPEMENIRNNYHNKTVKNYTIQVKNVDCTGESTKNKNLMKEFKVKGYPTVILESGNEKIEFEEKVTYDNIEKFITDVVK